MCETNIQTINEMIKILKAIHLKTASSLKLQKLVTVWHEKLITALLLWLLLPLAANTQGIIAEAGIVAQPGTALHISGNLTVKEHCRFDGVVSLTGHLEDHYGLVLSAGDILFNGDGSVQLISGESHTLLRNMVVAPNATVHVSPLKMLTINGSLQNNNENGGFVLKADQYGKTASLMHRNAAVHALVEKYFTGASGTYHMLSSPVMAQEFEPDLYSMGDFVYTWYEPIQSYVNYQATNIFPTFAHANGGLLEFLSAKAYFVSYFLFGEAGNPRTFNGKLHQGSVGFSLYSQAHPEDPQQGMNLMGNPYPSAIDWNAEEGWLGKEHLAGKGGVNGKSVWVWNERRQNYGAVLPLAHTENHNDVTGIIPAMQGFWVQAAVGSDGEMLIMDDRVRLHQDQHSAKLTTCEEVRIIRLRLSAEATGWADEVVIEFGHDGDANGAAKMFSPNPEAPQFFAVHHENEYSILLLNETDAGRSITLEAQMPLPGGHTLSIAGSDVLLRQLVVEDKHTGSHYRLPDTSQLWLDMPEGHTAKRFVLHFDQVE